MEPTHTSDGVAQTPANSAPSNNFVPPLNQADFNKKYWFNSLQMVTVTNPKSEDWPFMVEMRHFIVRAGEHERLPGVIANVYLDQMSKILAQDDDKLSYMTDPNLRHVYYDKLIVDVENLAPEYNPIPAHLRNVPPSAQMAAPEATDDRPPWESGMERATDVMPNAPPPPAPAPPSQEAPKPASKPEAGEKNFDLNGLKFSAVTSEQGETTFFKNGKAISEADYAKAASMI